MIQIEIPLHPAIFIGMKKDGTNEIQIPEMKYRESLNQKEFSRLRYIAMSTEAALKVGSKHYIDLKQCELMKALMPYITKSYNGGKSVQVNPTA
jgi:hypothetical protein